MDRRPGSGVAMWRAPGVTQIGTHPSGRIVLAGLSLAAHAWLEAHHRGPGTATRAGRAVPAPERHRITQLLGARGLLEPVTVPLGPDLGAVLVEGTDAVTLALADLLAARDGACVGTRTSAPTFGIVTGTLDAWVATADALMPRDVPHLLLGRAGDAVRIGPVVLPGRTACARCLSLSATAADPSYPLMRRLSDAGTREGSPPHPAQADLAAALALALILRDGCPGSGPSSRSLHLRPDLSMDVHEHRPHPDCGCQSVRAVPVSRTIDST